jgi:hypothetical protein
MAQCLLTLVVVVLPLVQHCWGMVMLTGERPHVINNQPAAAHLVSSLILVSGHTNQYWHLLHC